MKYIILLFLLTFSVPLMASDKNGSYWSISIISCGDWHEERNKDSIGGTFYQGWLIGYLSHYNQSTDDTYNILGTTDMKSVYLWIDKYCTANPLNNLDSAIYELTEELWPNRKITNLN